MKKIIKNFVVFSLIAFLFVGCGLAGAKNNEITNESEEKEVENISTEIKFIDDLGKEIVLEKPAEKAISLYSVHTENIYSLGAEEQLIGVSTSVKYPKEALSKTQYSYKDDPEVIIAMNPDVVIIRTMIAKRYSDYVEALESAGIKVITLYCSEFKDFDSYITRLGMIFGKNEESKDIVSKFHSEVEEVKTKVKDKDSINVYFESMGKRHKTVTPNSFAGTAMKILNTNNIASDVEVKGTSTVVDYPEETLLAKGNEIDFYIAQNGVMNRGVSIEEIKARPGYDAIKAINEGNVYVIEEKLISGATLRYLDGLNELIDVIYNVDK